MPDLPKEELPDLPKKMEMVYRDSVANIMFNKRQQWVITNYSIAALVAIVGVLRLIAPLGQTAKCSLTLVTVLVCIGGLYMLYVVQKRLTGHRARLQWIYPRYFMTEVIHALDLGGLGKKPRGFWYDAPTLIAMAAVIVAAGGVTIYLIWLTSTGACDLFV